MLIATERVMVITEKENRGRWSRSLLGAGGFAGAGGLVDRVHKLALDDAVARAGARLGSAEDGVDEIVVGRLRDACDRRVLDVLAIAVAGLDPRAAPAVDVDFAVLEDEGE